jgi:putative salt-induced outer membrane protein YdiY
MKGRYVMLKDKIILLHESYYQPSLLERDNYRWRADIGVEFSIMKNLAFKVNYLQTFESVVMVNQKRRDKFLTVGFSVSSY